VPAVVESGTSASRSLSLLSGPQATVARRTEAGQRARPMDDMGTLAVGRGGRNPTGLNGSPPVAGWLACWGGVGLFLLLCARMRWWCGCWLDWVRVARWWVFRQSGTSWMCWLWSVCQGCGAPGLGPHCAVCGVGLWRGEGGPPAASRCWCALPTAAFPMGFALGVLLRLKGEDVVVLGVFGVQGAPSGRFADLPRNAYRGASDALRARRLASPEGGGRGCSRGISRLGEVPAQRVGAPSDRFAALLRNAYRGASDALRARRLAPPEG